jgi:tRNA(fMet)-specific endonuclease VapC
MTGLLLDTNIISDMMRNLQGPAAQRAIAISSTESGGKRGLCTSVIVQCELEFGLARQPNPRLQIAYEAVIQTVDVLPLTKDIVSRYAALRSQLEAAGTPIGANDLLIAAHALALNATLVSADAEFLRVPGLTVENWLAVNV